MAFELLARKYRPKNFTEVIGQSAAVRALKAAVFLGDKQTQVILLTGTRGVGKTTLARIMAKARNCTQLDQEKGPCLTCASCVSIEQGSSLDFLEMDGASHNSVENVRELIESVSYVPNIGPYKIYVIDEVHMLSQAAFNALLKTIEEPPAYVQFIFATTEVDKIPDTILSRCLRFDLKSLGVEVIANYLRELSSREGIAIQDGLLDLLAREARGSVRDALTLFDQVRLLNANQGINKELGLDASELLGVAKESLIDGIYQGIWEGNVVQLNSALDELFLSNIDEKRFAQQLLDKVFRNLMEGNMSSSQEQMEGSWLFETLSKDVQWALKSLLPDKSLRIILNKLARRREWFSQENQKKPVAPAPTSTAVIKPVPPATDAQELTTDDVSQMMQKLYLKAPGTFSHLQQSVFLGGQKKMQNSGSEGEQITEISIRFGFRQDADIFYEYFNDAQKSHLRSSLAQCWGLAAEKIAVELTFPVESSAGETFLEIQQRSLQTKQSQQRQELLESAVIQKLQKTFDAKIDRISLSN